MRVKRSTQIICGLAALLAIGLVSTGCDRSPEAKSAKFMAEGKRLLAKKISGACNPAVPQRRQNHAERSRGAVSACSGVFSGWRRPAGRGRPQQDS